MFLMMWLFAQTGPKAHFILWPVFLCFQLRASVSFSVLTSLAPTLDFVSLGQKNLLLTFLDLLTKALSKCAICYNLFWSFPFLFNSS